MDTHTAEQRRKNMQAIKCKDTKIEILLRKELWSRGIHYRKNAKDVMGKPDIVFKQKKIAVFCDSEFWHGYNWETKRGYAICILLTNSCRLGMNILLG